MKTLILTGATAATPALTPTALPAQETVYTKGNVKAIDAGAGKVTILHEELFDLDMPALTVMFRADEETPGNLSEGEEIEFATGRVEGRLTVVELREWHRCPSGHRGRSRRPVRRLRCPDRDRCPAFARSGPSDLPTFRKIAPAAGCLPPRNERGNAANFSSPPRRRSCTRR